MFLKEELEQRAQMALTPLEDAVALEEGASVDQSKVLVRQERTSEEEYWGAVASTEIALLASSHSHYRLRSRLPSLGPRRHLHPPPSGQHGHGMTSREVELLNVCVFRHQSET